MADPEAFLRALRQNGMPSSSSAPFDPDSLDPSNLPLDAIRISMPRTPFSPAPVPGNKSYDWEQSTAFTTFHLPVPKNTRGRDLACEITRTTFRFGRKGRDDWVNGSLGGEVDVGLSTWELEEGEVRVTLAKKTHKEWIVPIVGSMPKMNNTSTGGSIERKESKTQAPVAENQNYQYAPQKIEEFKNEDKEKRKINDKWSKFDVDQALADLENEGTPKNPNWRVTKDRNVATVNCEDYQKSKEEVALDSELMEKMKGMKAILRARLASAQQAKERGNMFVKEKKWAEALKLYEEGADALGVAKTATVLMSDSLAKRVKDLNKALMNNSALCHLKLGQHKSAVECASEVLKEDEANYKALCRGAAALIELQDIQKAKISLEKALKLRPSGADALNLQKKISPSLKG